MAGGSVGLTLALDQPGSNAGTNPTASAPAGGAHAAATATVGESSAAALLSHYTTVINQSRADDLTHLLCGGTGTVADTGPEWSWAFLALGEKIQPSPIKTTAGGASATLTVTYQDSPAGRYGLFMRRQHGRWCVQAVNNGSLGMSGLDGGR